MNGQRARGHERARPASGEWEEVKEEEEEEEGRRVPVDLSSYYVLPTWPGCSLCVSGLGGPCALQLLSDLLFPAVPQFTSIQPADTPSSRLSLGRLPMPNHSGRGRLHAESARLGTDCTMWTRTTFTLQVHSLTVYYIALLCIAAYTLLHVVHLTDNVNSLTDPITTIYRTRLA